MEKRRQARLLSIFAIVLGVHLGAVWLALTFSRLSINRQSGSLELVWIALPPLPLAATDTGATSRNERTPAAPRHADPRPALRAQAPLSIDEDNSMHPAPNWEEELRRAGRGAVESGLTQRRHDYDFAHAFPVAPHHPPGIAWDYAATHRVEAIPGGGMLIHLSDNCVLVLFPLPFVGCGIGKQPADGSLFEGMHDQ